ncbi:transcriptional repressor [Saccharopolyspora sp. K220]|uniref:Fur family transcriptional regulator n=1 Tax=Saccharopolyspora soli TaxID=2926618 RepID=UPI001F5A0AA4|nr:Fur family transcriptional regulator [Saccharopolyspora soli]MCI2419771.1 transcriptional repressor [Saccharopolyspora soli]
MTSLPDRIGIQTRQRRDVRRALANVRGFVSAQTLHLTLRSAGTNIGLATVYRALHAFVAAGQAETIHDATGTQLYRLAAEDGRSYRLVCRDCQRRLPIAVTFVENWATAVATAHGFSDVHLVLEIAGRCAACSTPPRSRRQPHGTSGKCCKRSVCRC